MRIYQKHQPYSRQGVNFTSEWNGLPRRNEMKTGAASSAVALRAMAGQVWKGGLWSTLCLARLRRVKHTKVWSNPADYEAPLDSGMMRRIFHNELFLSTVNITMQGMYYKRKTLIFSFSHNIGTKWRCFIAEWNEAASYLRKQMLQPSSLCVVRRNNCGKPTFYYKKHRKRQYTR